jgi:hypothetical protein
VGNNYAETQFPLKLDRLANQALLALLAPSGSAPMLACRQRAICHRKWAGPFCERCGKVQKTISAWLPHRYLKRVFVSRTASS